MEADKLFVVKAKSVDWDKNCQSVSDERYNSNCCRMLHQSREQKVLLEKAVPVAA